MNGPVNPVSRQEPCFCDVANPSSGKLRARDPVKPPSSVFAGLGTDRTHLALGRPPKASRRKIA